MVRRCLKVRAGFLASLETPVARDEARRAWRATRLATDRLWSFYPDGDGGRKTSCKYLFPGKVTAGTACRPQSQHVWVPWEWSWRQRAVPLGKIQDTQMSPLLYLSVFGYTGAQPESHNESQWSWAWVMKSFAVFYPIVSQFSWIKNSWRYSFTSFFPCHFCFDSKTIYGFNYFLERLELTLDLEGQKILREESRNSSDLHQRMGHRHWFAYVCLSEMHNVVFPSPCGLCRPEDCYWGWEVPGSSLAKTRHSHLALFKSPTSLLSALLQVAISQAKPWQSFWLK